MDVIQWYPGHMVKTKKVIKEYLKVIDLVIEIADARIPASSRNPEFDSLFASKSVVIVFNKVDLADRLLTKKWLEYYEEQGLPGIAISAINKDSVKKLIGWLNEQINSIKVKYGEKGRVNYTPKILVTGIPNVGKSSLINTLAGKAGTKTGKKPGVTRGQQWINLKDLQIMDVPGVLWPKFTNQVTGFRLAATGAIGDHVYNLEEVAVWLLDFLGKNYLEQLAARFKLNFNLLNISGQQLLDVIGNNRGLLGVGGKVDAVKAATLVLKEFRDGKLGRVTLEKPEDFIENFE